MHHANHWIAGKTIVPRAGLTGHRSARVAVIGGGIAGLSAAQELVRRGVEGIVVVEAHFCGAGASGRSSGFITPASELQLGDLQRRFGDERARQLWDAACGGCRAIEETIERHGIECGYVAADSLYVASDERSFDVVQREHETLRRLGYQSHLYDSSTLGQVLGCDSYGGGVKFGPTFAINSFDYVRGLAEHLEAAGVTIYEDSAAVSVNGNLVRTSEGAIRAESVFFCLDHKAADIRVGRSSTYHAQTFLTISEPLDDAIIASLFPEGPLLVWDTDLIYQYYRLTKDRRLLVGGGLLSRTYAPASDDDAAVEKVIGYIRRRFPQLDGVEFESWWQGLIGVTKDLLPLAGKAKGSNRHYFALCAAGLPWSVLAAQSAVETALDGGSHLSRFLRPDRSFTELDLVQPLLRKPLTFALSHAYTKTFLKGDAHQISARKRVIAALAAVAGAAAALGKRRKR